MTWLINHVLKNIQWYIKTQNLTLKGDKFYDICDVCKNCKYVPCSCATVDISD